MRPFNAFGPKQKDFGYGGAISIFINRVLKDLPPIIYGDGLQTRDYTYVNDLINAFDAVLNYDGLLPGPINFGTGSDISIVELANKIIEICGKQDTIKPVHVEQRPGEVRRLVADTAKAKKLVGWQPQYKLEDGLRELIDWYRYYRSEEWAKPQ